MPALNTCMTKLSPKGQRSSRANHRTRCTPAAWHWFRERGLGAPRWRGLSGHGKTSDLCGCPGSNPTPALRFVNAGCRLHRQEILPARKRFQRYRPLQASPVFAPRPLKKSRDGGAKVIFRVPVSESVYAWPRAKMQTDGYGFFLARG